MARNSTFRNIAPQVRALIQRFPEGSVVVRGRRVIWLGALKPTELSRSYLVEVDYLLKQEPVVRVRSSLATREGESLPHVWNHAQRILCLHRSSDWTPRMLLANSILPWASEWLFFYEIWLVTGQWDGGGEWTPRSPAQSST
jgi:hypothetical protein